MCQLPRVFAGVQLLVFVAKRPQRDPLPHIDGGRRPCAVADVGADVRSAGSVEIHCARHLARLDGDSLPVRLHCTARCAPLLRGKVAA